MGGRVSSLQKALAGALVLSHSADALLTSRAMEWWWNIWCNNAPAGYSILTPTEAFSLRLSLASSLFGTTNTFYHAHDRIRLFDDTVLQNPAAFPTEFVFAEIGREFGFGESAEVFPISTVEQASPATRSPSSAPLPPPLPPLLRLHHTDDDALYDEAIGKLSIRYNFDDKNIATFVVIAHNTITGGEPTYLANERMDAIVPPPAVNDPVITFFRPDRRRSKPVNQPLTAMVMIAEPYQTSDGTIGSVHIDGVVNPAVKAIDDAITNLIIDFGIAKNSSLDVIVEDYRTHRHNFPFSTALDDILRNAILKHSSCLRVANPSTPIDDLLQNAGIFPIKSAIFDQEREKAVRILKRQVANGKEREKERRRREGSLDPTSRFLAAVVFTTAAVAAGAKFLAHDNQRRIEQRSLDKAQEIGPAANAETYASIRKSLLADPNIESDPDSDVETDFDVTVDSDEMIDTDEMIDLTADSDADESVTMDPDASEPH
jgi:hypothetical protein